MNKLDSIINKTNKTSTPHNQINIALFSILIITWLCFILDGMYLLEPYLTPHYIHTYTYIFI